MAVITIVFWQFSLGALMIIWRYGVIGAFMYTTWRCVACFFRCILLMVWKLLLWLIWFVAFCGCCYRCSLESAYGSAASCVERIQKIVSSIFLNNMCWEMECNFKLTKKIKACFTRWKDGFDKKLKQAQKSPLVIAAKPQWYWFHLTAQVGFLWREFMVVTMYDGWFLECGIAYLSMALVVFFSAQQVWKFSKVRNHSPDARKAIDQVLDMLLLPINYGFLCALCVRTLKMDKSKDKDATKMAIAVVDSADIWESWALWSVLQLFIRVVDISAKDQVGADQDRNSTDNPLHGNKVDHPRTEPSPEPAAEAKHGQLLDRDYDSTDKVLAPRSPINPSERMLMGEETRNHDLPQTKLVQMHAEGASDFAAFESVHEEKPAGDLPIVEHSGQESQGETTDGEVAFAAKRSVSAFVERFESLGSMNLGNKYLDVVASFKYLSNYGVQCWVYLLIISSLFELFIKGVITPRFPTICFTVFSTCGKTCDQYYDDEIAPSVYVVTYILCCAAIVFVVVFERTFQDYLHGIEPYWKFWGVKCVVSVTFAQKVIINHLGLLEWKVYLYHCLIICMELPLLCAVHTYRSYPYGQEWMFLLIRSDESNRARGTMSSSAEEQVAIEGPGLHRQTSSTTTFRDDGLAAAYHPSLAAEAGRGSNRRGRGRSPHRRHAGRGSSLSPNASSGSQASVSSRQSPPHYKKGQFRRPKTAEAARHGSTLPLGPVLDRAHTDERRGRAASNSMASTKPMLQRTADQGALVLAPASPDPEKEPEYADEEPSAVVSRPKADDAPHTFGCCEEDDDGLDEEQAARKAAIKMERLWVMNLYIALGLFWCFVGIGLVQHILPYDLENHEHDSSKVILGPGTCDEFPSQHVSDLKNSSVRLPDNWKSGKKLQLCDHMDLECAQGFKPHDNKLPIMSCVPDKSGQYNLSITGECDTTKCGAPIHIENARPKNAQEDCCYPGQVVKYSCLDGFDGMAEAVCQPDAHWKITMNNCQIVGCGSLQVFISENNVDNFIIFPKEPLDDTDSYDGQVVDFQCSEGLRGNPQAICYNQSWHLTNSGNPGDEPCAKFVTAHDCSCQQNWTHCTGTFFTECNRYSGCATTTDKDFAWCRVNAPTGEACRQLLSERNFFGQPQDWDYCVNDNFGIKWHPKKLKGNSWHEGLRVLAPQILFGLTLLLGFCATVYMPATLFALIVYCIPRVPGWKKLCYTCCTRPPKAIRRTYLILSHTLQEDTAECRAWFAEKWAVFMRWFAAQVQEWRQWYEGDTGHTSPSHNSEASHPDDAKLSTGWTSIPTFFQYGFFKASNAKERAESSETDPVEVAEAGTLGNAFSTPLLKA